MVKVKLNQRFSPYPMPSTIIGAIVDGKPNFMTLTWISRVNRDPPIWMVSINRNHHTIKGIGKNQAFSINFPSVDLLKETDYCGIVSGRTVDKSTLFETFYGETNAPMIRECFLNIELIIESITELPDHFVVLGTAINTFFDEEKLMAGKPDMIKMNPIVYTGIELQPSYWTIGEKIADAFEIGKELKK